MPMAFTSNNGDTDFNISDSEILGLSFYNDEANEIKVNEVQDKIKFWIARDHDSFFIPKFIHVNKSDLKINAAKNQFLMNAVSLKGKNRSLHIELMPSNPLKSSYIVALTLGDSPRINNINDWKLYCPNGKEKCFLI